MPPALRRHCVLHRLDGLKAIVLVERDWVVPAASVRTTGTKSAESSAIEKWRCRVNSVSRVPKDQRNLPGYDGTPTTST